MPKILAIDDKNDNLIGLKAVLKDLFEDVLVITALSGQKGLELAAAEKPDIILLDVLMPGMDGYEVCERLKANPLLTDIPVIFITALRESKANRLKALKVGAEAFLSKPIDETELTVQIRTMLKISAANELKRNEKDRLAKLVSERTLELEKSHIETLKLLDNLKSENKARKETEEALQISETTIKNKLKAITEPDGDIGTLELSDIIDTQALKSLMEDFFQLTGMLGAVLDVSGKVLVAVGWQDICTKFHRCNPNSLKKCIESDTILSQSVPKGEFKSYRCKNNMWDTVTPLIIGGKHLGNVFMGQYLIEDEVPDVALFRKQARKYGFDEEEYLAALDRVPRFSKEAIERGMRFYAKLTEVISTLSFSTIQQSRLISERKQSEQILKESEERFRQAITYAPYPIMIHAEGKVLQLSKEWTNQTGYTLEDIPTIKEWRMKAYGTDAEPSQEFINNLYEIEKAQYDGEWNVKIKNGSERIWEFSSSPIGELPNGKKMAISMASDITERKLADRELLKAKDKAEESDRLKSAFLANMSHEIRTPMNGILGFAELLKRPNLSGEQQNKFVGIIQNSGNRMLNIINNIVDISKIESGLMLVNLQESNINEQIEYIYNFFKPEVEKKGIQFSFSNSLDTVDSNITTDREKVYAILTNLVKNAIKFTPEGSLKFGYLKKNNYLEFYVKDTGIGIPKERQQAIFERFIQADIEDKNAYQGAGLGLSISSAYVKMLGGDIWVESVEGEGSCFYFTLPIHTERAKDNKLKNVITIAEEVPITNNMKFLIAEDDEASAQLISIYVEEFSNEVITVGTGTEAVSKCLNNPDIDVVLMDILMPEMDGLEATRKIRSFNKDVVIIAQSAFALEGDRDKAITAGCDDYITKPVKATALKQIILKNINENN